MHNMNQWKFQYSMIYFMKKQHNQNSWSAFIKILKSFSIVIGKNILIFKKLYNYILILGFNWVDLGNK